MKRIVWTQQETTKLIQLVKQLQSTDCEKWQIISEKLRVKFNISKSPHQCQKRWQQCHRSKYRKGNEKSEELSKLFNLHMEMGSDWKQISKHLNGRTDIDVKHKFLQSVRKGLRKIYKFYRKAEGAEILNRVKFVDIYQFLIKLNENEKTIVYHLIEWFCLANRLQVNKKKLTTQQTILTKLIVEQLIQTYGCLQSQLRNKNKYDLSAVQNNEFEKLYKNLEGYQNLNGQIKQAQIQKCIDMIQKDQRIEREADIELFCVQKQDSLLQFYKSERQLENQFQIFQEEEQQGQQQANIQGLAGQDKDNQIITKNQEKISHQIRKPAQISRCDIEKKKSEQKIKIKIKKDYPSNMTKEREEKKESDQQSCDEKILLLSELCQDQIEEIGFELGLEQYPLFSSFGQDQDQGQHSEHEI